MRAPHLLGWLLAALALGVIATAAQDQQPGTFRASAQTVAVYATVIDRTGRLVTDLKRTDFEILDNGKPVTMTVFSNDAQPVTVALMLDMSGSMERKYVRVREAAQHFVDALGPGDRVSIGSFGEEVAVSPMLTGNKADLSRILREELWSGGGTPLWSAIDAAMTALSTVPGRRIVLVLTDGRNACVEMNGPCQRYSPVGLRVRTEAFMIYAIGMEGTGLDTEMKLMADDTGGGAFELAESANVKTTLSRVLDELHHQYALGFPAGVLDGSTHTIEVKVKRANVTARARKSYIANAPKAPPP